MIIDISGLALPHTYIQDEKILEKSVRSVNRPAEQPCIHYLSVLERGKVPICCRDAADAGMSSACLSTVCDNRGSEQSNWLT